MAEEIRQRLVIEGDQAVALLERVAALEQRLAESTGQATQAGNEAADAGEKQRSALDGVSGAVVGMVGRWLTWTAIASTVVKGFADVAEKAKEAAAAVAAAGSATRSLSASVGGREAAATYGDITRIAAEQGLSVGGRSEVLRAVAAMADLRPGMDRAGRAEFAQQFAELYRGTQVSGETGAQLLSAMHSNLGLNMQQSQDMAATLLTGGISGEAAKEIVEKGGDVGGVDLLALLYAARGQGIDINRLGRSIPMLAGTVTRRDASGQIAAELAAAGVAEGMQPVQAIAAIIGARQSGRISDPQFEAAIGGAENRRFFEPLARALPGVAAAKRELLNPQALETVLSRMAENPLIAAEERANLRELRATVRKETSAPAQAYGEAYGQMEVETQDLPWGVRQAVRGLSGAGGYVISGGGRWLPERAERDAQVNQQTVINATNIYYSGDPTTAPPGRVNE